ncbi:MAG: aconitate hydratase [Myxococcota bacterium]
MDAHPRSDEAANPTDGLAAQAAGVYARLAERVGEARAHLGRPLTLADKLLFGHLHEPPRGRLCPGESRLVLRPDRVVLQDVLGQTAMLQFAQLERERVAIPTSIHCDHLVQARDGAASDLSASRRENDEVYTFLRSAAARYGAGFWAPGAGIIHQVVLETYAFPGALVLGTDSHTPNAGGLGACAVGVGGADAVEAMAGLPWELRYPRRIGVVLRGVLSGWASPKDVILWLAGRLTTAGGTHAILEYLGPGTRTLAATGKATIANMGAEVGATTSVFPADDAICAYLRATGRGAVATLAAAHAADLSADPEVEADPGAHYDEVIDLDLSTLEPHVVGPHAPDRARPLSQLADEVRTGKSEVVDALSAALVGSCTNSSYQDLTRAAQVAAQASEHGVQARVPLWVTPGSERTRATVERDGQLEALRSLGARELASACGPCIGQWRRQDGSDADAASSIVTSFNRNFRGRNDGRRSTQAFIASPELVVAFALAGRLSFDPTRDTLVDREGRAFRLDAPTPAPDVPPDGFAGASDAYVAPPADGRGVALTIAPDSERLQRLEPWPAWDGRDFQNLPVLIKTAGRTTTDQISPAGAWLRYRGHLERFSENLLSGAIDAFLGTTRKGVARQARAWQAEGLRWVIVGDANYGEGSSREHAALSPRLLGCAAVIARGFARIHESNLKKQGILALTFRDPAHYDRVGRDDRIDLTGLATLGEGAPVEGRIRHADGTTTEILLEHSYTSAELVWFRAGSALNAIAAEG